MRTDIERLYQQENRRVLATLIRLLGDFDLAEEALHEAFMAALKQWPEDGIPDNPRAWLVSAGRFKAIDQLRRRNRHRDAVDELTIQSLIEQDAEPEVDDHSIDDDPLRLIFTCCHPALARSAQLALTLREVCGLRTEEVARAFLTKTPTIAQRIVRAKTKIRDAGIPYEVPERHELAERLESVLAVVYLLFNEGYAPSDGDALTRPDLAEEAIRLGRMLAALLPEPEVLGLLALMLLHHSRRPARSDATGELVRLQDQDRSLWDQLLIAEGCALVPRALTPGGIGPYGLQAAIAALHAEARTFAETDWAQILGLYEALLQLTPSPIIALNRAVALGMSQGAAAGLAAVDALLNDPTLQHYHLTFAARADFCRQLGQVEHARVAYQQALTLTSLAPEQRFLQRQLQTLG
ncbi:RNA polymerase subunit sigma-24 [Saccharospirillum sp. MSK14-1]|uniref:RNA polymerase sigma factor n=1 Tax=Saccharospirillum sp. MSK14-1 TaxID=1897632 RepID=UPI000D37271B|nr:RNA polymerase sigma factor [Saccharospirillum sp. MSK14-1]PTY37492.1 RNA polymerase subunit sigma-24 [Saccharospirillum sp. MSK14-1]